MPKHIDYFGLCYYKGVDMPVIIRRGIDMPDWCELEKYHYDKGDYHETRY